MFEMGIMRLGSNENGFFYRYRASYISPRVIDHYPEGSVVAYHAEQLDEVIAAEQGDLTDGEKALLDLLKKELRRELRKAA